MVNSREDTRRQSEGGASPDASDSDGGGQVRLHVDEAVAQLSPGNTARKYRVVPLRRSGATLTVALTDPTDLRAIEDIRFITGCNLRSVVASEASILAALETYYLRSGPTDRSGLNALEIAAGELADIRRSQVNRPDAEGGEEDQEEMGVVAWERLAHDDSPSPVVRFVNVLLAFAIHKGASDIHVEPYESACRIRLRLDAVLHETVTLSPPSRDPVVSRLKVMANLDIAERRLPQDGRVKLCFRDGGTTREVDFRVSCLPTLFGEKVVLRLLDRTRLVLDLSSLGLEADSLVRLVSGERSADSVEAVAAALQREQIVVSQICCRSGLRRRVQLATRRGAFSARDLAVFTRQLSVMLGAGLPIAKCLAILATQQDNPHIRGIVGDLRMAVDGGAGLGDAMRRHPAAFGTLYTNMIDAGELSGNLETIVDRLAVWLEKQVVLRGHGVSAVAYPAAVAATATLVVAAILWKVIPTFASLFDGLGATLPLQRE